jgi:hypothetical protein
VVLATVVLDDRLLVEELLVGLDPGESAFYTTTSWYYRACRAAVAGGASHLSGPFRRLAPAQQERAIASMLQLRDDIGLPDPRHTVPVMVDVAGRHPKLNLLNLEAVAAAHTLRAAIWLSPEASAGLLPSVLDSEGIGWRTVPYG